MNTPWPAGFVRRTLKAFLPLWWLLAQIPQCEPALAGDSSAEYAYYRPADTGSDRLYNPLSAFFSYTLDTLQLPDNFGTDNYRENLGEVWNFLLHPRRAIDEEGGFRRFVNREILPVDAEHRRDSFALLPNYGLHLLGDGVAFRKDLEWMRARGYRYPRLTAALWAMVSEVLQEGLEQENTTDADAIADVYIFRPLGILLFSQERLAQRIGRALEPMAWPSLLAWDLGHDRFINAGMAYAYRPPVLDFGSARGFIYTGLTNLFGLSHPLGGGRGLSWGIGVAVEEIVRQRDIQADVKPSVGVFHDRHGSLLWSAVINDAGRARFRLNVYPWGRRWWQRAGLFLSLDDENQVAAGLVYRMPIGAGVASGEPSVTED